MRTASAGNDPVRIVRPGVDGGKLSLNRAFAAAGTGQKPGDPMRVVRPGGASGVGAAGALVSTAQMAQGGRFVRPGQGADTRPAQPGAVQPAPVQVTDVPTPQP